MDNVLIIGSGGREHAIAHSIVKSSLVRKIFAIPGNAGIAALAECYDVNIMDNKKIVEFCKANKIDFVIVGPENPLVNGLVDELQKNGIKAFGPSAKAAKLEGSKKFMKEFCKKYKIPTAKYESFSKDQQVEAVKYAQFGNFPVVIKTDGLAAGKGVIIAKNKNEATQAITEIFSGKFGAAGDNVVIEEFLEGPEVSYFVISDGKNFLTLGHAGDHKRVGDGDTGLNTGGMGTYSPSPFITNEIEALVINQIIKPTINGMKEENSPFVGVLFAGLMLTKLGPKLLEFNVRLGDPETEVILLRIKSDLYKLLCDAANGDVTKSEIEFSDEYFMSVVMASKGYPENYQNGYEVRNLSYPCNSLDASECHRRETKTKFEAEGDCVIFHCGTKKDGDRILTNGGRVLCIVSDGSSLSEARDNVYKSVTKIECENLFYRKDIGTKIVEFEKFSHEMIEIGQILTCIGVKGEFKIQSFMQNPKDILEIKEFYLQDRSRIAMEFTYQKSQDIFVAMIESQSKFHLEQIYTPKFKLKKTGKNEFYHFDLIGKEVYNINNTKIGIVANVMNFGAGDVIEIELTNTTIKQMKNKLDIFPFNREFFLDNESGLVILNYDEYNLV